jgi:hypothetical protein
MDCCAVLRAVFKKERRMKKVVLGLAAALISTAAFAQSSPGAGTAPDRTSGSSALSRQGQSGSD